MDLGFIGSYRRICKREADYHRHRKDLKIHLHRGGGGGGGGGYSRRLIESQLQKVDKLDRLELLKNKNRNDKNAERVRLVVTYSNLLPDVHGIIKKHTDVLYRSTKMKDIFQEPPMVAFRR